MKTLLATLLLATLLVSPAGAQVAEASQSAKDSVLLDFLGDLEIPTANDQINLICWWCGEKRCCVAIGPQPFDPQIPSRAYSMQVAKSAGDVFEQERADQRDFRIMVVRLLGEIHDELKKLNANSRK